MQTSPKFQIAPVRAKQLILEVLVGALAGLACAALGGLAGARLLAGAGSGWGDLIGAVLGGLLGYTVGAAIGVYAAGRRLTGRGSIWLSLLGAVLGALLVMLAAEPLRLNSNPALLQAAFAIVIPIAAVLVFNIRGLTASSKQ